MGVRDDGVTCGVADADGAPPVEGLQGFWLRFEAPLEAEFRRAYVRRSLGQMRFTLVLSAFFYALFALLDLFVAAPAIVPLSAIRFGVFLPVTALVFSLSWRPWFPAVAERLMTLVTFVGGAGIIAMLPVIPVAASEAYYAGLMLVFIVAYTWARIPFAWATAVGWLLVLLYEIVAIRVVDTPDITLISNNFFFVSCNVLAMLACRSLERFAREEFLVTRRLREQEEKTRGANEQLARLAELDGLTGIANRRAFDEVLDKEWRRGLRKGTPLSLVMGDIDYFKDYNDALGHLAGDDCLRAVAKALQGPLRRPMDLVARFGGEEFSVLLPDTDRAGASLIGAALLEAIRGLDMPHPGPDAGGRLRMSFGLATTIPSDDQRPQELVGLADAALYSAKRSGRDRVVSHVAAD